MRSGRALCWLDSGAIVGYQAACLPGSGASYDPRAFEYIGDGVVFSVDGVRQLGETRLSFFNLRKDRPRWMR